jgi:hypothetical protein
MVMLSTNTTRSGKPVETDDEFGSLLEIMSGASDHSESYEPLDMDPDEPVTSLPVLSDEDLARLGDDEPYEAMIDPDDEVVPAPVSVSVPVPAPVVTKPEAPTRAANAPKTLEERLASKEKLVEKLRILVDLDEDLADSLMEAEIELHALRDEARVRAELAGYAAELQTLKAAVDTASGASPELVSEYQTLLSTIQETKDVLAKMQEKLKNSYMKRTDLEKEIAKSKSDSPAGQQAQLALAKRAGAINKIFGQLRAAYPALRPEDNPARGIKSEPGEKAKKESSGVTDRVWSGDGVKCLLAATLPDGSPVAPRSEEDAVTMAELWDRAAIAEAGGAFADWLNVGQTFRRHGSFTAGHADRLVKGLEANGYDYVALDGDDDEETARYYFRKR